MLSISIDRSSSLDAVSAATAWASPVTRVAAHAGPMAPDLHVGWVVSCGSVGWEAGRRFSVSDGESVKSYCLLTVILNLYATSGQRRRALGTRPWPGDVREATRVGGRPVSQCSELGVIVTARSTIR
jgi:hypothetical protein